jgi:hypothetical protein
MQELLLWVDTEAEQGRTEWRDGFDWRKFQEQIERKCVSPSAGETTSE